MADHFFNFVADVLQLIINEVAVLCLRCLLVWLRKCILVDMAGIQTAIN